MLNACLDFKDVRSMSMAGYMMDECLSYAVLIHTSLELQ